MTFIPGSPFEFQCNGCGAKAGSRCIVDDARQPWEFWHTERDEWFEYSYEQHAKVGKEATYQLIDDRVVRIR